MLRVIVGNKYIGEGETCLKAVKDLPEYILEDVYREANDRVCQNELFTNEDFPLNGELEQQYNRAIDDVLMDAFDFKMEINNHSVKWEEI